MSDDDDDDDDGETQACTSFVESDNFELFMCAIVSLNTILIGVECQDIRGPDNRQAIYTFLENCFAVIYCLEIPLRLCHFGFVGFFCAEKGMVRNWFHFILALLGAVSMSMSVFGDKEAANSLMEGSSVLRFVRVLRIFPTIRLLYFLKDLEYVVTTATSSALRCGFLCLFVIYISAVIITHLLYDSEDEVVVEMFGHLTTSMWHLFEVLVDGFGAKYVINAFGGPQIILITARVDEVSRGMWIFWIFFVFAGSIALTDLVPSIFVVMNLHAAERQKKLDEVADWQKRVEDQRVALDKLFMLADVDKSDGVSRQELEDMLQNEAALKKARLHDILEQKKDIQMEVDRVFDELPPGYTELSHKEFLDVFSRLRSAPISAEVLALQKEVYSLRSFIRTELAEFVQAAKGRSIFSQPEQARCAQAWLYNCQDSRTS